MPWGGHRHDIPEKYIRYYEATKITPAIDKGYSYPGLTQEELRLLDHAHETAHLIEDWTVISPDEAAAELEERLAKYPNEQGREVIKRLKNAWTTKDWTPDIAIKSFFDLDRLYFRGYLRKRARLRWKGSTTELWKAMGMKLRETLGITLRDDTDTVPVERMILNARLLLLETKPWQSARKQTFATLLHEMIHAYLGIRCARNVREIGMEDPTAPDPNHGRQFQRCRRAISRRTKEDIGFGVAS